jgi:hypothetical protein
MAERTGELFTTLMARAAKHLLVLLLAHALAALLDERSHKARNAIGQPRNPDAECPADPDRRSVAGSAGRYRDGAWPVADRLGGRPGSFNGRTAVFGAVDGGSNPLPGTMNFLVPVVARGPLAANLIVTRR